MPLSQYEQLLISAQLIKIHEGILSVDDLDLITSYKPLITSQATHIEYSISLVETVDEEAIFVIFPGSNDKQDWIANLKFTLNDMIYKPAEEVSEFSAQGLESLSALFKSIGFVQPHANKSSSSSWSGQRVHSGFMRAYYGIEDSIMRDFDNILKTYPGLKVYGTGHSLGSAMLRFTLLDAHFKGLFKDRKPPIIHTFGAPRMGNGLFIASVRKRLPNIIRVVHRNDLVTRLPLPLIGYRHEVDELHLGEKQFWRWFYRDDIKDHYLEAYIRELENLRQQ